MKSRMAPSTSTGAAHEYVWRGSPTTMALHVVFPAVTLQKRHGLLRRQGAQGRSDDLQRVAYRDARAAFPRSRCRSGCPYSGAKLAFFYPRAANFFSRWYSWAVGSPTTLWYEPSMEAMCVSPIHSWMGVGPRFVQGREAGHVVPDVPGVDGQERDAGGAAERLFVRNACAG